MGKKTWNGGKEIKKFEKCSALNNGIYPYICGHVLVINNMNL